MFSSELIGTAAAAGVLALVALAWFGKRHKKLRISADFSLLRKVAEEGGQAAPAAKNIMGRADPFEWSLLAEAFSPELAQVLEALAALGTEGIRSIQPENGEPFNPVTMVTEAPLTPEDRWVVESVVDRGWEVRCKVAMPARVKLCTLDWWLIASDDGPVGRAIRAHAEDQVLGSVSRWRAPWGFLHPENLRQLCTEDELATWRKRLMTSLNRSYTDQPDRCLAEVAVPDAPFEVSTMETQGPAPVGDARVVALIERQGVPQQGLACQGGSALLTAVVITKPWREGDA